MRRRKRPETHLTVFKYRAYPGAIPEAMWSVAKRMQWLWNSLCAAHQATRIYTYDQADRKKEVWLLFETRKQELLEASALNWECGPAVLDRFQAACGAAIKNQREWPHHQRRLQIMIPHRFTGGGALVKSLFSPRAERISVTPVPALAYRDNSQRRRFERITPMRFGLDGETITGKIRLHRPLPDDAIVKQVAWIGTRFGKDWEWHVTVTLEQYPVLRKLTGLACAVDVGWRLMDGGEIRVAVIADSLGNEYEVRVPLLLDNARSRRHEESISLHGWPDLADLDRQLSAAKTGQYWEEYRRLASIRRHLYRRLTRRRDWVYQNLGAWLADGYDQIVIEGKLTVKVMAEDPDKDFALSVADRYRQIAAPATLHRFLRNAARSRGAEIVEGETAYSTLTCWICAGQLSGQNGSLWLRCPRGHMWDQDVNAATNLLSQTRPVVEPENGFRQTERDIPEQLRKYVTVIGAVAERVHAG